MKAFIVIAFFALICQVYSDEFKCALGSGACATSHTSIFSGGASQTCEEKAPYFKCLRDGGCSTDDLTYKTQVTTLGYEKCGASAIIMGWTLPILMMAVTKYFSK